MNISKVINREYADFGYLLHSNNLKSQKQVDIFLPIGYTIGGEYPLIILNDGQDAQALKVKEYMNVLMMKNIVRPFVLAAVHASNRNQEYGVAKKPDYENRGGKAKNYLDFICTELIPFLQSHISISNKIGDYTIMGMSLGGLSAFDIAWHAPNLFGTLGVFSASFWWRSRALNNNYFPNHRILHDTLAKSKNKPALKFWMQVGTRDEKSDRNRSGIIDAIEDTLDIIQLLRYKGYILGEDIEYVEVQGGKHDLGTWSAVLPDFFKFAYPLK